MAIMDKDTATEQSSEVAPEQIESIDPHTEDPDRVESSYWMSPPFLGSMFAVILMANCTFISYSLPVNLLGIINADIGPSANITLVTLIHTLIKGVMFLLIGRISDIFGRRWFLIGGQLICSIGSIICALAPTVNVLIGGTVLLALGGSCQPLYPLLCQEIVPNKYRGWSQAAITVAVFPFMGFGPAIGRSLVTNTVLGWRWTYWINTIFCLVSVILFFLCYYPPNFEQLQGQKSKRKQLSEIDWIGLFLYVGGLVALLLAFVWSTREGGWKSTRVIAPIIAGGVGLAAFVLWQIYGTAKEQVLPIHLLRSRAFVSTVIVGVVGQMAYYAFNNLWPQEIVLLYTTDNTKIGWMSSTTGAALAVGEIITGPLFKPLGNARWQMIISTIGLTLFCGLMAYADQSKQSFAIACTVVAGLFIGWVELVAMVTVGLVTPPKDIGVGQGCFSSFRNVGGTIATSIFLSIYGNRVAELIPRNILPVADAAGLPTSSVPALLKAIKVGTAAAFQKVPGMNAEILAAVQTALKSSYSSSFATVYLSSLAFGGVALIAAFFTPDVDSFLTDFVNKRVDGSKKVAADEKAVKEGTGA